MKRMIKIVLISLAVGVGILVLYFILLRTIPDKLSYLYYKVSPEHKELKEFILNSGGVYKCSQPIKAKKTLDRLFRTDHDSLIYVPVNQLEFEQHCQGVGVVN